MADSTLPIGGAIDLTRPSETAYHTWLDVVQDWVDNGRPQKESG